MAPAIDIFVRTYFRDFRWLSLSLLSILKFVEGYRRIVIVMPESSYQRLRGGEIPASARTAIFRCDEYADDYIGQQIGKLNADLFTDARFIVHLDSDCIFQTPCPLPTTMIDEGLPVIRVLEHSRRPQDDGWRRCISDFYGERLPFDVLVPPPFIYGRDLYARLRDHCRSRHRVTLDDWALSRRLDNMSEFGLLAAHAWFFHRREYRWNAADGETAWPCRAYWSRSPEATSLQSKLALHLGYPCR
ncbi:hypothetical protein [Taklimakanibacter deserti]|uniref:hypothetical protein n=1 Tax=Taklimakanibacter deserti TaxID=2267839 RepID=UPI000E659424